MSSGDEISISYARDGADKHLIFLDSPGLPSIAIDYTGVAPEQRSDTSVKLLCASALYCFASTLGAALSARKANVRGLTGRATAVKEKDEIRRTKVTEIVIDIQVDIDDKDLPILEKCKTIAERGCLITYCLEDAIEITHSISRT